MASYTKRRKLLFGGIIALAAFGLGVWFYNDFFVSPVATPSLQKVSTDLPKNSTAPPNDNEKKEYNVLPTHPRRLMIPSIGVDALIKPVGVLSDNTLGAPQTAWDVGWYEKSSLPGSNGAMLFDGHVNDSYNTPGVFSSLKQLKPDAILEVERGDRTVLSYRIVTVEQTPVAQVDMRRLLQPTTGDQGLNLITCGGSYDKNTGTYSDRVLVFAVRA